jgi:predicted Rossmann-fold nucleotide-binding protein
MHRATGGRLPETPQTRSPSFRLAFRDADFLEQNELRPVRLQLELLKFEMILQSRGIVSTVVMFGGARIPAPNARETARTKTLGELSHYYDEARKFAHLVGAESVRRQGTEYVVCTGGGPGVMEAGSQGAHEAGADTIGLGIVLPREEAPKAVAVFPGGFGTLDELFETLTLIQTARMEPIPVLLFGRDFWQRIVNWEALADAGTISPDDLDLFNFVETAEEGWEIICDAEGIDA